MNPLVQAFKNDPQLDEELRRLVLPETLESDPDAILAALVGYMAGQEKRTGTHLPGIENPESLLPVVAYYLDIAFLDELKAFSEPRGYEATVDGVLMHEHDMSKEDYGWFFFSFLDRICYLADIEERVEAVLGEKLHYDGLSAEDNEPQEMTTQG